MPELPEVETTKRGIAPHITGKKLSSVIIRESRLRWPISPELEEQVSGRKLQAVERRGKYLLLQFNSGTALWHLGMSGNLRIVQANTQAGKHDHVDWVFGSHCVLRFNDPRRFGSLLWAGKDPYTHKLLTQLGPEPLSDEFDGAYLYQRSRGRSQAIKTFIMDSKVVVGVGNIYANEALFSSGIHPLKSCAKVSKARYQILADNIKNILTYAINRGGTTLRDFVGGDGKPGYFAQELQVYGHASKPCPICQKPLTEKKLSQRSTVYCVNCQR